MKIPEGIEGSIVAFFVLVSLFVSYPLFDHYTTCRQIVGLAWRSFSVLYRFFACLQYVNLQCR